MAAFMVKMEAAEIRYAWSVFRNHFPLYGGLRMAVDAGWFPQYARDQQNCYVQVYERKTILNESGHEVCHRIVCDGVVVEQWPALVERASDLPTNTPPARRYSMIDDYYALSCGARRP